MSRTALLFSSYNPDDARSFGILAIVESVLYAKFYNANEIFFIASRPVVISSLLA
jgi:hypothetical protein